MTEEDDLIGRAMTEAAMKVSLDQVDKPHVVVLMNDVGGIVRAFGPFPGRLDAEAACDKALGERGISPERAGLRWLGVAVPLAPAGDLLEPAPFNDIRHPEEEQEPDQWDDS